MKAWLEQRLFGKTYVPAALQKEAEGFLRLTERGMEVHNAVVLELLCAGEN